MNSAPFASSSRRASATSATRTAKPASFGLNSIPSSSGFQNDNVTFGVSTSPGACSLSGSPSTSRYQATARATSRVGTVMKSTCSTCTAVPLADRALHLELDQAVHLHGVLQWKLLRDRLDEAGHDHRGRLGLGQPARHQVEELLLADLRDGGLVADVHVVLVDADVRIGIRPRLLVEDQRVADDLRLRAVGALDDLEEPTVRRAPTVLRDRLRRDRRGRPRRDVDGLTPGVLMLALVREGDREHLS